MNAPPTRPPGGAGPRSGLPPVANVERQSGGGEVRRAGWSLADPSHRRNSGPIVNPESLSRQKSPVVNDSSVSKDAMSSSFSFWRSTGSSRRAAVSSSRDAVIVGSESDLSRRPQTTETSSRTLGKISAVQNNSPVVSSEQNRTTSGRNISAVKNLDSTLRGMETLHFNNDERVRY